VLDELASMSETSSSSWYAGAIDVIGKSFAPYEDRKLKRVDDIDVLLGMIRSAPQLLDGIFVAIDGQPQGAITGEITADGPMLPVTEGATVEVHAFDTTWIEIYSRDSHLIEKLKQRFPGGSKVVDTLMDPAR
jgi:hypothetical protein